MAYGEPWTQPGREIITNSMIQASARTQGPRVDVPGFNATVTIPLYTMFTGGRITKIIINSDTATTGSSGSDNYEFMLNNVTQTQDLMAAAVTTNGNEIVVNTAYVISADQNQTVAANDVIALVVTKNGTATNLGTADLHATFVFEAN